MEATGASQADIVACYRGTVREVHRYLSKLTAGDRALTEDLVQETYLAMVRALPTSGPGVLSVPWLLTTARHAFLQTLRSGGRREARERSAMPVEHPIGVDQAVVAGEEARRLLRTLPADQRAALVLRYVDDLAVAEIARLLGRSVRATESLLVRASAGVRRAVREETDV